MMLRRVQLRRRGKVERASHEAIGEPVRAEDFDLADVLDRMSDIVLLVGTNSGILDANPAALEAYGHSIEQIRRLKMEDISAPEGREGIAARLGEAVASSG